MIAEWSLESFKSVAERQTLNLRPLTVFAGANSSGKSTVLQSMLLLRQTLASKVERRALLLNGELVRLGTLNDVVSQVSSSSSTKSIKIAFRVEPSRALVDAVRARGITGFPLWFYHSEEPATVEAELCFGQGNATIGAEPQRPELIYATFATKQPAVRGSEEVAKQGKPRFTSFTVRRRKVTDAEKVLASSSPVEGSRESLAESLSFAVETSDAISIDDFPFRVGALPFKQSIEIVGADLGHFLPQAIVIRHSAVEQMAYEAIHGLRRKSEADQVATIKEWHASGTEVEQALSKCLSRDGYADDPKKLRKIVSGVDDDAFDKIIEATKSYLGGTELAQRTSLSILPPPRTMMEVCSSIAMEFSGLRYLGPLRDEPRPLYNIGSGSDPKDVGIKGEFTAAVLDVYGSTQVDFVPPTDPGKSACKVSLRHAVHEWLGHFDIAKRCDAEEAGKLGHRLYILPTGLDGRLDLTNVGVGVSQVLPILVMALISAPGSVLLFEQPELHLHPRVQALLADFFISMIQTGRQCIVETHSEYLVNRLRRRVAESDWSSKLGQEIRLYFVERSGHQSTFAAVDMNPYGAIVNWPAGFFDQGPAESEMIMAAAARKKASKPQLR